MSGRCRDRSAYYSYAVAVKGLDSLCEGGAMAAHAGAIAYESRGI
jgi:hypothetical protein